ncbi:MAG: peptidylprolyl isomerase [Rhodococcus sp. (in: high G+C Gram-positive bacteria)]|jgi:peptidyl-prolyl cis-trans isomerase B (cyclophilin B)|uniref:peptidylprolyl isomerase n=1 Tax=Rhodococcus sp. EPR-157 TaxID=1813677 RepID=UPI0007BB452F|nr:peptidylprolyl isomerase [Rhodococcus sp. EPR-157]KZF05120.1 cyclophilin [Rhodococcus sp. EPR-157]
MRITTLLAAAGAAVFLVAGCSSTASETATTSTTQSTTSAAPTTTQPPLDMSQFGVLPPVPEPDASSTTCEYPEATPAIRDNTAPANDGVSTVGTVDVAITTSQGPIGLTLDRAEAPCTVNSFTSLASQGYFDDTICHRLTTTEGLEVLQCGDPSGQGNRGPGYEFANEYPTTAYPVGDPAASDPVVYPRGTVAMANAGPDTNGSQFFLVYEDSVLPPQYTVFGTIDDAGLATLDAVAAAGVSTPGNDGPPNAEVTLQSVATT